MRKFRTVLSWKSLSIVMFCVNALLIITVYDAHRQIAINREAIRLAESRQAASQRIGLSEYTRKGKSLLPDLDKTRLIQTGLRALRACHRGHIAKNGLILLAVCSKIKPAAIYSKLTMPEVYKYAAKNAYHECKNWNTRNYAAILYEAVIYQGVPVEKIGSDLSISKVKLYVTLSDESLIGTAHQRSRPDLAADARNELNSYAINALGANSLKELIAKETPGVKPVAIKKCTILASILFAQEPVATVQSLKNRLMRPYRNSWSTPKVEKRLPSVAIFVNYNFNWHSPQHE